jgi:putative ABC transport system permease protein
MYSSRMFWRIVGRLLTANYARLCVILLALGAGAAITAALLNLQIDAKRRLTSEFRALGANVIVAPPNNASQSGDATLDESILHKLPTEYEGRTVPAVAFLYLVGEASKSGAKQFQRVVLAGTSGDGLTKIRPGQRTEFSASLESDPAACELGAKAATSLAVHAGDTLVVRNQGREENCRVFAVVSTGGAEDSQIFAPLALVQTLANRPGRISLIQLSVTGTPTAIEQFLSTLSAQLPDADVHGIKQFTQAESRLYNRISGLLSATVLLVLVLTSLSVMAGMTNIAAERKNDVGLMKAIGGSVRRVAQLFFAEAFLLGLAGGILGSAVGILGSIWLGQTVFGVAAQPRWIVYPVSVALTVLVSVASGLPLRRLASVRPASVFRGEM